MFNTIEKLTVLEFVDICSSLKRVSNRKLQWLELIKHNRLECPISNLKVSYVGLDENKHRRGTVSYHYNFYSECGKMFTIDHIIPRSKGGKLNHISNIQPMISKYNGFKGDKNISNSDLKKLLDSKNISY